MDYKLIAGIGFGAIAGAVFLIWGSVQVWNRTGNPAVNEPLTKLLTLLDTFADAMEVRQTRYEAIAAVQALLGWRRIFVPQVLIGWALDALVWMLRRISIPDLHHPESFPAIAPDPNDKEGSL